MKFVPSRPSANQEKSKLMKKQILYLPILLIILIGCSKNPFWDILTGIEQPDEPGLLFDSIPTNFTDLNSEYDDYNSAYPPGMWGTGFDIVFSSSRKSEGENFDFISYYVSIMYDYKEDTIVHIGVQENNESFPRNANQYVNSEFDELGPFYWKSSVDQNNLGRIYTFLYSSNPNGNHDINMLFYFEHSYSTNRYGKDSVLNVISLEDINTQSNELYPSIRESILYFTSDRSGSYNLYQTDLAEDDPFNTYTLELADEVKLLADLSSSSDDKCPFVMDSVLIFTSNRAGGFGGYDLYYSEKTDEGWSAPVNFGENINTEYDEYRPIVVPIIESENNLMIFSSNRPGGKGGFDLYYVGTGIGDLELGIQN